MARQAYGSGSLVEVKDGSRSYKPRRWRLRVYLGRVDGKIRHKERRFEGTDHQARKALAAFVHETRTEQGKAPAARPTTRTVGDLFEAWLRFIEPNRRPSTLHEYRRQIETGLAPLAAIELDKLSAYDLDKLYGELQKGGLSTTTVRHYHATVSAALHQAERWGWIAVNPARKASPPAFARHEISPPTPEQVRTLIDACGNDQLLSTAIQLAVHTGLRRGELVALRWNDCADGVLTVARAITVTKEVGGPVFHEGTTKTDRVRHIELDAGALKVIEDRQRYQKDLADCGGFRLVENPFLLSDDKHDLTGSAPINPNILTERFAALVKRFGWSFRLHDLRHYVATQLIAAGQDIKSVSDFIGHSQVSTTVNIYTHGVAGKSRQSSGILSGLLDGDN